MPTLELIYRMCAKALSFHGFNSMCAAYNNGNVKDKIMLLSLLHIILSTLHVVGRYTYV